MSVGLRPTSIVWLSIDFTKVRPSLLIFQYSPTTSYFPPRGTRRGLPTLPLPVSSRLLFVELSTVVVQGSGPLSVHTDNLPLSSGHTDYLSPLLSTHLSDPGVESSVFVGTQVQRELGPTLQAGTEGQTPGASRPSVCTR